MMNLVILMGRLTADPELKSTQNGKSVVSFSIAVERNFKKDSERQSDFFNCVAWSHTAEFISKYFVKGQMIAIQGELRNEEYTKDGQKRYYTKIYVTNPYFCGSKSTNNANTANTANNPTPILGNQTDNYSVLPDQDGFPMDEDDDMPF